MSDSNWTYEEALAPESIRPEFRWSARIGFDCGACSEDHDVATAFVLDLDHFLEREGKTRDDIAPEERPEPGHRFAWSTLVTDEVRAMSPPDVVLGHHGYTATLQEAIVVAKASLEKLKKMLRVEVDGEVIQTGEVQMPQQGSGPVQGSGNGTRQ